MSSYFDRIHPALHEIGAELLSRETVPGEYEQVEVETWRWADRLVRLTFSVADSLGCDLSQPGETDARPPEWISIFRITVPNMAEFSDAQKLDWLMSVPKGTAYAPYLADHIRALPSAVKD